MIDLAGSHFAFESASNTLIPSFAFNIASDNGLGIIKSLHNISTRLVPASSREFTLIFISVAERLPSYRLTVTQ